MSQFLATHVEMCLEVFPPVGFLRRLNAVLHKFMDSVLVDDERRAKVSSPHQLLEALHRHNERRIGSGWRTDGGGNKSSFFTLLTSPP